MKNKIEQIRQVLRYRVLRSVRFVRTYWFKALLIGLFSYSFYSKEVSIGVRFNQGAEMRQAVAVKQAPVSDRSRPAGRWFEGFSRRGRREKGMALAAALPVEEVAPTRPAPRVLSEKEKKQLAYVERFASVATAEMVEYGIPASITLAQGLLESNAGESPLATQNNNHFGIKCFSRTCSKGHCRNFSDDHHKDFFRNYNNAWESFRAHSRLLTAKRYRHLLELPAGDYRAWAQGLQEAGYATDPAYARKLVQLIEDLELSVYDQ